MSDSKEAEIKIELKELEPLLRKCLNDELIVVSYTTEPLLPPGENYGSTILKVHAKIKRYNDDTEEEELHMVAKMPPATEFQRKIFDSPYTFRKEAFLYEQIIPSYILLYIELEINEDFRIAPRFYGVRYSLKSDEDFDDNAVILMQNIKVLGYYTGERREGLDLEHMRTAIKAMARFHSLGIALKNHKPDRFEIIKYRSKCLKFGGSQDFEDSQNFYLTLLKTDPEMGVHAEHLEAAFSQDLAKLWNDEPPELWGTIIHSDFWVNNIMFHKDANGKVDDVMFVDFQNYLYMSPLRELVFFLMDSSNAEVIENHVDELIDFYYVYFIHYLKKLNCNIEPFNRDAFNERLKIDAFQEFPHCPFMLKIMTTDVQEDFKVNSEGIKNLMTDESTDIHLITRLRRVVKAYVERGWLDYNNTENEKKT